MKATVDLGRHDEELIRNLVESGRYASATEVLRDGLRLMREREADYRSRQTALRAEIAEGLSSGPAELLDMDAVKAEARRRGSSEKPLAQHGA